MPNAATIYQMRCASQYERDGIQEFVSELERESGRRSTADALKRAVLNAVTVTVLDVTTPVDVPANVYGIAIKSPVGATNPVFVQLFNTAKAGVTVGTTVPVEVIRCNAAGVKYVRYHPGNDGKTQWSTAFTLCCASTATGAGAPAAGDRPDIWVVYD